MTSTSRPEKESSSPKPPFPQQRLATPGHAAAAASLALTSPSRLSRVSLSAAQTTTTNGGSGNSDIDGSSPYLQRSTSDQAARPTSALTLSVTSSQELDPFNQQNDVDASAKSIAKAAPSISVDLAEFPPARRANHKDEESHAVGTAKDVSTTASSTPKRPTGVDFLTQRLRSAIGQELLVEDPAGDDEEESAPKRDAEQDDVGMGLNGHPDPRQVAKSGENDERDDVERRAKGQTSKQDSQKATEAAAWSWSALTNIPAALRIDGALQSFSIQSKSVSDDQPPAREAARSLAPDTTAPTNTAMNYINALDVRRWFSAEQEEDGAVSQKKGKDVRKKDETKASASSAIAPSSPLHGMPAGSYPSSSLAHRKKKEAERAQLIKDKEEKRRKAAGDNAIEIDLTQDVLGAENEKDEQTVFAPHEYLVLSTAGKPVFWSKVSKARLERAKVKRRRKRSQQDTIEAKQREGIDTAEESSRMEKREEELAYEEQTLQDEEDQTEATRVGLLQAIISNFAESDREKLHGTAKEVLELPQNGKVCFLLRPPLYLVAVSRWDEAESALRNHLDYLYQAIISLVSATKLNRLFDRAANFDLKRLLQGTDNILDALLTRMQGETIAMRGALQPLRLDAALRHDVGAALLPSRSKHARPQDALYALLLTRKGIVTLARRRKVGIHPTDCHLLINTVMATKALKEGGTQTWVPICLPKFASHGFVYAHVSFLDDEVVKSGTSSSSSSSSRGGRPELGLVLITGNPEGFEDMSAWRERLVGFLQEGKLLENVLRIARMAGRIAPPAGPSTQEASNPAAAPSSYSADELGLAGLRHFCFKWRSNVQSTSPSFEDPYRPGSTEHRRLLHLYDLAYDHIARASKESIASTSTADSSAPSPVQSDGEARGRMNGEESETTDDASSSRAASIAEAGRKTATASATTTTATRSSTAALPSQASRRPSSPPIVARSVLMDKSSSRGKKKEDGGTSSAASAFVDAVRGKPSAAACTAMYVLRTPSETIFAWSTQPFELYLTASPHLSRASLVTMAKAVVRWVKQEEHRLFIVSAPVF